MRMSLRQVINPNKKNKIVTKISGCLVFFIDLALIDESFFYHASRLLPTHEIPGRVKQCMLNRKLTKIHTLDATDKALFFVYYQIQLQRMIKETLIVFTMEGAE